MRGGGILCSLVLWLGWSTSSFHFFHFLTVDSAWLPHTIHPTNLPASSVLATTMAFSHT